MAELRRYTPTIGMLRALTDAEGATPLDYYRCRLRGLADADHSPTALGRAHIQLEIRRRAVFARGRSARG